MIRPLTIATCLLACGSGLYLYQSKHEVQLLDRTIERTVHDTATLREQSRLLVAEWTMLNDPERLRQFSDTYLDLKTITPSQFSSNADLGNRLPAPEVEVASHGTDQQIAVPTAAQTAPSSVSESAPIAAAPAAAGIAPAIVGAGVATTATAAATVGVAPPTIGVADGDLPVPPIPTTPPATAVASASRSGDARISDRSSVQRSISIEAQPHPALVADARPADPRFFDQRPLDQRPLDQRPLNQRLTDQRPFDQRLADQRPLDQRPVDQHWAEQRVAPRIADAHVDVRVAASPLPRPIVLAAQRPPLPANGPVKGPPAIVPYRPAMVPAPAPYGGSLLGMARGSMPAVPRPTPVSATYNSN